MDTKNQYKELSSNLIKDVMKVMVEGTKPKTEKEKKLAAMAPPEDEITHGDVVKARIASSKTKVAEAVEVKRHSTDEPNVSKRTITYGVYKDGVLHHTFPDVDEALAHSVRIQHEDHKQETLHHLKTLEELVKRHSIPFPRRPLHKGDVEEIAKLSQKLRALVGSFGEGQAVSKIQEAKVDGVAAGSLPNDGHLCASKIMHEEWGEGTPIYSQHAEPNADGTIDWYDVMFEHGIEKNVPSSSFEVLVSESHMNHKKKKMKEEVEQVDEIFGLFDGQKSAVQKFASIQHENWRKGFDPEGSGKERIKKNSDGTQGNINVPFNKLHPDWQKENLAAGKAAYAAVRAHSDMERAAEHVHNEWMKRNPKADYNAAQHVPYSQLPESEKEKDREHIRTMRKLLKKTPIGEEVEQVDEIFGLSKKERYAKKRTELARKIVAGNPEARAQRMQAMRINKTGEKAVAPELVGRYADDGEDADESPKLAIAAQMRHAFDKNKRSQKGYTVTFDNGQKVPVPAAQAHVFLTTLSKLSRNADMRDKFLKQAGKSYEGFLKAIGGNE